MFFKSAWAKLVSVWSFSPQILQFALSHSADGALEANLHHEELPVQEPCDAGEVLLPGTRSEIVAPNHQ